MTVLAPDATLRWACGACGGARVPGLDAQALAAHPEVVALLAKTRGYRLGRSLTNALSIAFAVMAFLSLMPVALVWKVAPIGGIVVLVTSLFIAAMSVASRVFYNRAKRDLAMSLDDAWTAAAAVIGARMPAVTASELARVMRIPTDDAEKILSRLSATSRARVDVGDDAELRYRIDAIEPEAASQEARTATERGRA